MSVSGFVRDKSDGYTGVYCAYYQTDDPKRLYEDEEAIFCDTVEEAFAELKQRHPDIDEHYGYVKMHWADPCVYDKPGLLTDDLALAKSVLIKHGPMQCHVLSNCFKGKEGFVVRADGTIRYDEKVAESRTKKKEEAAGRLTITELHDFLIDLAKIVPEEECLILDVYRNKGIIFNARISDIHRRALAFTELVIGCGDLKNRPDYEKMKARWNSYTKFGKFNEESLKAIAKLRAFFA